MLIHLDEPMSTSLSIREMSSPRKLTSFLFQKEISNSVWNVYKVGAELNKQDFVFALHLGEATHSQEPQVIE